RSLTDLETDFDENRSLNRSLKPSFLVVHSVIASRVANAGINTLHLDIAYAKLDNAKSLIIPNLIIWLNFIVQRQLNYLDLHFNLLNAANCFYERPRFPNIVFSCNTLVVLNLSWFSVDGFAVSCSGFGFLSLKTLNLKNINFYDHQVFMLLLAGCPVLEDIKLCNIVFLSWKVDHPAAERLYLSKLIRADITDCPCFPIKAVSNSEFLRFQMRMEFDELPIFHNLTHLVINNISDLVLKLLHYCPKLQNLVIYQKTQTEWDTNFEDEQGSWLPQNSVPQCFSSNLRTCTIRDFAFLDLEHDMMLARHILNNAGVLETMTISIWGDREQHEIEM
ncbi:F-box/RNI/FBD-like domain protein, partial [Trifolium pratense]